MADTAKKPVIYANTTLPNRNAKNNFNPYGSTRIPSTPPSSYSDEKSIQHFGTLLASGKSKNAKNYSTQSLHRPPKTKSGQQKIVEWLSSKRKPSPKKSSPRERYFTGSLPRDFNTSGYYGRKFNIYSKTLIDPQDEAQHPSWSSQPPGLRYMDEDFYEASTGPPSSNRTLTRYDIYGNIVHSPEDYYKRLGYGYTNSENGEVLGVPLPPVDYTDSDSTFSETSSSDRDEEEFVEDPIIISQPHRVRFKSPPELIETKRRRPPDDTILYEGTKNSVTRLYNKIVPTVQNFIAKKIKVDEKDLKKKEQPPKHLKQSSIEISLPILPKKEVFPDEICIESGAESPGSHISLKAENSSESSKENIKKLTPPKPPPRPKKEVISITENFEKENLCSMEVLLEENLEESVYGTIRKADSSPKCKNEIGEREVQEVEEKQEYIQGSEKLEEPKNNIFPLVELPEVLPRDPKLRTPSPSEVMRQTENTIIYQNSDIITELGLNSEPKVCYLGDTRIEYTCEYTDDNVIIHFTSTEPALSKNGETKNDKIQRRGAITDIEYGPGIVQKLRDKFSQMAKVAVKEAQLSPHSRRKRYPSTDDFLTDGEKAQAEARQQNLLSSYSRRSSSISDDNANPQTPQENRVSRIEHPSRVPSESHSTYLIDSKRSNKIHDSNWVPRPRPVAFYETPEPTIDRTTIEPISQLRAKFDQESIVDRPKHIMLPPGYRSRSVSVTSPKQQRETVPEFVSIGQKLRKNEIREQIPSKSSQTSTHVATNVDQHVTQIQRNREVSAPSRIFAEEISETTIVKDQAKEQQRTKQNGTPLPAKYFGSEFKTQMVKPPKGFQQRPYSLPRETGDMPRPVRVLDLLSPPADPEPKGQFFVNTPDRIIVSNSRNISPPLSTTSSDRSPPPEEPIQHPRTQPLDRSDNESIINQDELTTFELENDMRTTMATHMTLPVGRLAPATNEKQHNPPVRIGGPGNTPVTSTPKITIVNDNSGIEEMQRLLNKFNAKRESKILEEANLVSPTVDVKPTYIPPPLPPKSTFNTFIPAPPPLPLKGSVKTDTSTTHSSTNGNITTSISYEPKRSPFGSTSTSPIPVAAVQPMTLSISVGETRNQETEQVKNKSAKLSWDPIS
uniref:Uncharacterized protein n=1 Tax=Acrobeloides nanus TaxID=290746 RepID=A0A914EGT6_9BILA